MKRHKANTFVFGAAMLLFALGLPSARASSIRISALSSACICFGNSSDVSSSANTGDIYGPGMAARATSGPYALTGPGGSYFFADGWSYADTSGTLRAYSEASAENPWKQSTGVGASFWTDTLFAACDLSVTTPGSCGALGYTDYLAGMELDDGLTSANFLQYGGGGFAHYYGSGLMSSMAIDDSTTNGIGDSAPDHIVTMHFHIANNTHFDVGAHLDTLASAQEGFAIVDVSSTGLFSLQALTPGGSYVEQDGIVFATSLTDTSAAPEPGTGALAICALLLGLARVGRSPFSNRQHRIHTRKS